VRMNGAGEEGEVRVVNLENGDVLATVETWDIWTAWIITPVTLEIINLFPTTPARLSIEGREVVWSNLDMYSLTINY
jgi:hypothetical protein